jgi:hypothetical protein
MATITRLKSGSWRVQVRRKGKYVNETGYDACKILAEQGRFSNIREGRIFERAYRNAVGDVFELRN